MVFFFSLKHWLAFFTWSEKVGGQWHLQVHALKSLQEVRLRCCDANRTCELSITYHANLESIIPQSYLASRVLFKKNKTEETPFCASLSPPVQWGAYITKLNNLQQLFWWLEPLFHPSVLRQCMIISFWNVGRWSAIEISRGRHTAVICNLSLRCSENDCKNMAVQNIFLHLTRKYDPYYVVPL